MLSMEQRKFDQLYQYRAGMLNTAWIAGVARGVTAREGFIQQSNNINQMIHFTLDDGDVMPSWVKEGVNIKIIGRVLTSKKNDEPVVVLKALAFETPSIYDMPPRAAWERNVREGIPTDGVRPENDQYRPDADVPSMGGVRVADAGNMVKVAGFVSSFFVEKPGVRQADGKMMQGCLVLTLRQTQDKDDLIPIRCFGTKAESLARRLEVGVPLKVEGKLRVRLKNTGEPADDQGILPVHKYLYVHCNNLGVANRTDITDEPEWAKNMVLEHRSKRQKNPITSQNQSKEPVVLDSDLQVSEEVMRSLEGSPDL